MNLQKIEHELRHVLSLSAPVIRVTCTNYRDHTRPGIEGCSPVANNTPVAIELDNYRLVSFNTLNDLLQIVNALRAQHRFSEEEMNGGHPAVTVSERPTAG